MELRDDSVICGATRRNLRYILLWPSFDEELKPGKKYFCRLVIYALITSMFMLSVLTHLVTSLSKSIDVAISEDVAVLSSIFGIIYMMCVYIKNIPEVALVMRDLSDFKRFGKPPKFDEKNLFLNFLANGAFVYFSLAVCLYDFTKFLQKSKCQQRNLERNLEENCGFLAPVWTPFRTDTTWVYWSLHFYIFAAAQLLMKPNILVTYNAYEISQNVILRIEHLSILLDRCFNCRDYVTSKENLRRCIRYHTEVISLANRMDRCFSNGMLTHLAITGLVCACIEKQFAEGDHLCAVMHVSGWIFTLVFACVAGQLTINASERLPRAVWFSKWYEADVRLQKDLLFLLTKSQKNICLTVGPLDVLSLSLLVSVLKMSYSVFCFLSS